MLKKRRGGKYLKVSDASGYYGTNDAGTKREFIGADAGTKREFIGSGTKEFTFYSDVKGLLTVRADSYEEAWRIARARGYSRRRYKR